jgi:phosphoribosyl 1,2-cyclic phosphate phosphodiesterase
LTLQHGAGVSLGYRVGSFAYLVDCNAIPEAAAARLQNIESLVIDALRFRPHSTHFNIAQAIEVAGRLGARRTFLTHLSHDVDHARHAPLLPAGVELAYDGLRIEIGLPG